MRIGLSGTGRIGRLVLRKFFTEVPPGLELVAVNTTTPVSTLAHLLKYDSVHGKWDAQIGVDGNDLIINGHRVKTVSERNPDLLPWKELGVELVIDATGKFTSRADLARHLASGSERALLTAPGKDLDLTVVMGVNEERYDPEKHRLISAASCTTNCLAPVLSILDRAFGVKRGWMTSIHAYTSDQNLLDNPHRDLRRARSCTSSMVPTTTGVSKALVDVLPGLAPFIHGVSVRVPTQNVSLVDLQVELKRKVDVAEVRQALREAAQGEMGAYVGYNEIPLVSVDYIGCEQSAVVDGLSVMAADDQVKLLAWYDNEWGYSCRVVDLARWIAQSNDKRRGGAASCLTTV